MEEIRSSQPFSRVLEAVFGFDQLQPLAAAFARHLVGAVEQNEFLRPPLQFVYQKCLANLGMCPDELMHQLGLATESLGAIFELDQQQIITSLLVSCRRFLSSLKVAKGPQSSEQLELSLAFQKQLSVFLGRIIVETQSEDYCAKRLLVP